MLKPENNLEKEAWEINNPAMCSYMLWIATLAYYQKQKEPIHPSRLFCLFPFILYSDTRNVLLSSKGSLKSYLAKFSNSKAISGDIPLSIHFRIDIQKNKTLDALIVAFDSGLLVIDSDSGLIKPNVSIKPLPNSKLTDTIKELVYCSTKIGRWLSEMPNQYLARDLKVIFFMFFQIEKVVLWSKEAKNKPRVIEFALNKVNLITGSSKSGKSSLIPIIDYCLGSSKCSIPVNTIRDTTAWYGVQIKTKHSRLLIARRDPSNQLSTSNAFFVEAENIEIPQNIEKHNVNIDTVKNRLNEISCVYNISFDFYDTGRIDKKRTSTRDLSAFNYQPQNIIANPNALFYKTYTK